MTAGRHHVLKQGLGPKTNGVYTWWPLFVISGLAQASYTVQRIEAQTKKNKKTKKPTKQTKNNQKNQKKKTKIWPNIAVGRLVAKSLVFLVFWFFWLFWFFGFFVFFCFFGLVGFCVFFSEFLGNSQKWSICDRFSNAVNSFRIVFGNKAVRRPN